MRWLKGTGSDPEAWGIMDVSYLVVPPDLDGGLSLTLQSVSTHWLSYHQYCLLFRYLCSKHKLARNALDASVYQRDRQFARTPYTICEENWKRF